MKIEVSKNNWAYYALALFATVLWGSAFPGAKIGFEYMPPMMLSGVRFTLAGLILLPFVLAKKLNWREQVCENFGFLMLFAFAQSFLQYGLFYVGLNMVPGAVSAIIIGAGPLFVTVIAHFTLKDDRLNARKIFAILLGVAGVASISITGEEFATSDNFYLGIALLLTSNIIGSYTNIMIVKHKTPLSPMLLTFVSNFSGGLMLFIASLFIEPTDALHHALPMEFYVAIVWLAIIPAVGFSIWYYLLSLPGVKVSELNMLKFIIPIVGVVLSWWLLPGEYPTWSTVIGIAIISSAVLVLQLPMILRKKN